MKKLLAAVAVLASALALLLAPSASADNVCAPITVDGQPIFCTDTQPVDDVIAEAGAAYATVTSDVNSMSQAVKDCGRVEPQTNGVNLYVAYWSYQSSNEEGCEGYKVSLAAGTSDHLVHVPQICLTTIGTCVGPVDEFVPEPDLTQSPLRACVQKVSWWGSRGSGQWTDTEQTWDATDLGCVEVPAPV